MQLFKAEIQANSIRCSYWTYVLPIVFFASSWMLFIKVYDTTKLVIDEEFHLRQGLSFCRLHFDVWDSKITTFPGLYLVSVVLHPLGMCNIFGLRLLSLIAAAVNITLFYKIRRRITAHDTESAIDAFTLSCLPPLYFFSHIYYTDVMALTFVLLFYYNWLKDSRLQAAVFGAASVLMRQTNIIWIGMTVGITAFSVLFSNYEKKMRPSSRARLLQWQVWQGVLTSTDVLFKSIWQTIVRCALSLLIILPFLLFIILNGSIVVGDKKAHEATLHLPQIFYFSLFSMVFAVSNTLQHGRTVLRSLWREKRISIFVLGVLILIVKWNTHVHPYLLADNRHYTFYLWNRFYGRYTWFKYAVTPVYLFAMALMIQSLRNCRDYFQFMFWLSVCLVLCFQRLLEIRYFLIPFVLLRLHMKTERTRWGQILELMSYGALNALTFYLFFTKEITWKEYRQPQRLIW